MPLYWYRQPQRLSASAGMHRFIWDVHYQPIPGAGTGGRGGLPITAIPGNSGPAPTTPWVNPGTYTLKLAVDGKSYTQPIVVKQDPRVKTPALAMRQVYTLTKAMYDGAIELREAAAKLGMVREQLSKLKPQAPAAAAQAIADFEKKTMALEGEQAEGSGGGRGGRGGRGGAPTGDQPVAPGGTAAPAGDSLLSVSAELSGLMNSMQAADVAPTANTLAAVTGAQQSAARVKARLAALQTVDLPALNLKLEAAGLERIR